MLSSVLPVNWMLSSSPQRSSSSCMAEMIFRPLGSISTQRLSAMTMGVAPVASTSMVGTFSALTAVSS